ncbi:acyl-CoA thioesterase [Ferruginibacter yonginensis]|uniref:Acyl-CoA thioesterase n=1 Tax=Ferruginibacter yonginensis TaxID=1310416 RepID=A0ABV8QPL0_9BACT
MARVKIDIATPSLFSTQIPVRITDVNYGNHVGNDALVSMVHEARMQWLTFGGFSELDVKGAALIMGDLAVAYKSESFYGDILDFSISVDGITSVSFEIYYQITTVRNGITVTVAQAKTGMVCYDYTAKKVVAIPAAFKKFLSH